MRVRFERRLSQPRWLTVAVPAGSLLFAFAVAGIVLLVTGHNPITTYRQLFNAAFIQPGALGQTLITTTPLIFTGLAAAAAFRMRLFNIGAEGQLYLGAIFGAAVGLYLGDSGGTSWLTIAAMVVAGCVGGALWGLIPGVLRAFFRTGKPLPPSAIWPSWTIDIRGGVAVPLGLILGLGVAVILWVLYQRTRFGFEVQVVSDSERAARYGGVRIRRKILAVMAISGAIAGLGGASQVGDFSHSLDGDPNGLQKLGYGYTGIVVAALARYNPFATCVIAFLIGGLENAGNTLQGADFPAGLVGVIQGIILFSALGGEMLVRYRVRLIRPERTPATPETA